VWSMALLRGIAFLPRAATRMSSNVKHIGLDVHKEAISIAVLNSAGKLVMESIIETQAATLLQFLQGLRGKLPVTLEEGAGRLGCTMCQPHK